MAESSDVDRLLGCFRRGLEKRTDSSKCKAFSSPVASQRTFESAFKTPPAVDSSYETPKSDNVAGNEISPGLFYGSPFGKPPKAPPQFVLKLQDEIRKQNVVWSTFAKQEQAIQFADNHRNKQLALFVYQDHFTGQRRFLVTTYDEFWTRYDSMQHQFRHHYEVIREDRPCHLYFDVEFNRLCNVSDGDAMVDGLLEAVQSAFHNVYALNYEPSWTLELDSSTEEKFSRHLIIRVPKTAFKNNAHAGAFVAQVCADILSRRETDERFAKLYVTEGDSRESCQCKLFVDQAVYSRNRSFRLPYSSKAGKTAMLLPTHRLDHRIKDKKAIFMESLICKMDRDCETLLTCGHFDDQASGSLLVGGKQPFGIQDDPRPRSFGAFTLSGASPFPDVDAFIESLPGKENIIGKIRSWYWFSEWGVLVYNISGNRYCERIERQHKSNNIMYIVDFRTAGYYQKCHDPDCRGYKCPLRPLPQHVVPEEYVALLPESLKNELWKVKLNESPLDEDDDDLWWQEVVASL